MAALHVLCGAGICFTMWKKVSEPIQNTLSITVCAALLFLLIVRSDRAKAGMTESLSLCAAVLVPSLFPMLILSDLIASCRCPAALQRLCAAPLRVLFGLSPGCLAPLILGLTGGYPLAAKTAASAKERGLIGREDARRLTLFFTCPGLPFSVTAAGAGFFGSRAAGATLFAACAAADVAAAIIYNRRFPAAGGHVPAEGSSGGAGGLIRSVERATGGIFSVCAWVCAFGTLLTALAPTEGSGPGRWLPLFTEVTAGARAAAERRDLPLTAACLAFGGLCIFCQLLPEIKSSGVGAGRYLCVRLLCAAIAMGAERLLLKFAMLPVPTESRLGPLYLTADSAAGSAALLFLCAVFMAETSGASARGRR